MFLALLIVAGLIVSTFLVVVLCMRAPEFEDEEDGIN